MTKLTFEIADFTPTEKANPYTEHIAALIAAGEGKALAITVWAGVKRDGTTANGTYDRNLFQKAGNDAGYTARVRDITDLGDGTVKITFTLGAKQNRGPRSTSNAESATVEDVAATE